MLCQLAFYQSPWHPARQLFLTYCLSQHYFALSCIKPLTTTMQLSKSRVTFADHSEMLPMRTQSRLAIQLRQTVLSGGQEGLAGYRSPTRLLEQVVLEDEPETISSEILLAQGYCCCLLSPSTKLCWPSACLFAGLLHCSFCEIPEALWQVKCETLT